MGNYSALLLLYWLLCITISASRLYIIIECFSISDDEYEKKISEEDVKVSKLYE